MMGDQVTVRVSLKLPISLKSAVDRHAERDSVSLNEFISMALTEKVSAREAADFFAKRAEDGDAASAIAVLQNAPDIEPKPGDRID